MIKNIKRFLAKLRNGNQLTQWGKGDFYVEYPCKQRSMTMYYSTAMNYAAIFGGDVKWVGDDEV